MKLVTTEGWIASTCGRAFSLSRRNRSQSLHTPCFPAPPSSLHFPASRLPSSIIRLQSGDPPLKSGQDMNWHTSLTRSSISVKSSLLIHTTHHSPTSPDCDEGASRLLSGCCGGHLSTCVGWPLANSAHTNITNTDYCIPQVPCLHQAHLRPVHLQGSGAV